MPVMSGELERYPPTVRPRYKAHFAGSLKKLRKLSPLSLYQSRRIGYTFIDMCPECAPYKVMKPLQKPRAGQQHPMLYETLLTKDNVFLSYSSKIAVARKSIRA